MEFAEPQVRPCKKLFPNCISKRNPEALQILFQNVNIFDAVFRHLPHSQLQFFAFIADVGARLCCNPVKGVRFGLLEENVQAARSNNF